MWWSDCKELKEQVARLTHQVELLQRAILELTQHRTGEESEFCFNTEVIKTCIEAAFESEEEYSSINRIHDKLNHLLDADKRKEEVELATKTLDKFEDYMKNVDKLNEMANEMKGCVSMARGAIGEGRALTNAVQSVENLANISKSIYQSMTTFIQAAGQLEHKAHYKIDYIYNKVEEIAEKLQNCEKKSRKPRKSVKKKRAASPALESE